MNKKILIQGILLLILVVFLTIFIVKYFFKDTNEIKVDLNNDSIEKNQNLIRNIKYSSKNKKGDTFFLTANHGEIDLKDSNQLFLHNVRGKINFIDGKNLTITSSFADFNNKSFETKFIKDVIILTDNEKIYGDELYIVLDATEEELIKNPKKMQNRAILSGNIKIFRKNYQIKSDVVEIDLITFDSKVYMLDKNKKVIIENN